MEKIKGGSVRQRNRVHTGRRLAGVLSVVLVVILCVQMMNLYTRYVGYRNKEASLQEELTVQKNRKQDLKDYEKYTKTKEYTESTARSKLGLLYDNEIIFKEK
ncbi:MAG: septum formation initiator family protein [Lachnospiraceae bacterium]|nr:septum formation initiator family protein [Lachnospiraceae bacterium]